MIDNRDGRQPAPARLLLIDLENSIGSVRPRQRLLRSRIAALLAAARPVHHSVAGYAAPDLMDDPTGSVLAELGVAPLRVTPAPDAAELVLLDHARRMHDTLGCRTFLVASADRRFAELATLGRLELLAWQDQPLAGRLEHAAHHVHRIPKRTAASEPPEPEPEAAHEPVTRMPARLSKPVPTGIVTAVATGMGIGIGQRLIDVVARRRRHGGR